MSFAAKGVVPPHAAFALVLGANLGSPINPVLEGMAGGDWSTRWVAVGNLLNRLFGVAVGLALLDVLGPWLVTIDPDNARAVADFHTGFNVVLAVLFLPPLNPMARFLVKYLPSRVDASYPSLPRYLDQSARETPTIALAAAAREALRMVDVLETMLQGVETALQGSDRRAVAETRRQDDMLDRLNTAIRDYITGLDSDDLGEADMRRITEILTFTTNLEHADAAAARTLVGEKTVFRDLEQTATEAHFARLRNNQGKPLEQSALHLDLLRDLKRINAHLVAAAAYPVLQDQGTLRDSRLRDDETLSL